MSILLTEWNRDNALAFRVEEGLEKGHTEKALEIARKMKNAGRLLSEITEFTGLPVEASKRI